tara:strand:+ start:226 stop:585 length:360 start_codon:yes stop_codon:yes gene_type:complete
MIIVVGLVGGVVYGGYYYYQDTQQRLKTLQQNNAKLEVAVKSKEAALQSVQENAEKQLKLNKELSGKLQDAEKYQDELRAKLQKHDLTRLSQKKPGLIEKKINEGTEKLFTDFESVTSK